MDGHDDPQRPPRPREQPPAPRFPRRAWLLGPVSFTVWIVGVRLWEHGRDLFVFWLGPIIAIANLVALFEFVWILLAFQGHRRCAASWLLGVYWSGLGLAVFSGALGADRLVVAASLLMSTAVAVLMPVACRRRESEARVAER